MFKTDSMDPVEIKKVKGKGNKGTTNLRLFVNQYEFYYNNKRTTKYHWRCVNFEKCKCKGRAYTNSIGANAILIDIDKNSNHTCIPNLQSNIPMPTIPTSMPYYSYPTAAPPLTTSVSVAATPSVSSLINSEEDPNMLKAQVFAGNLNEVCASREMFCNKNSPILYDSTDAHEMSKDYCNGEIVDEEKQTYTYDKKPISPKTTTSTTSGDFNGLIKNSNNTRDICNARDVTLGTIGGITNARDVNLGTSQTTFNQHTTNFIVCSLDSLKQLDVQN